MVNRRYWLSTQIVVLWIGLLFLFPAVAFAEATKEKKTMTFGVICPTTGPVAFLGQYILDTAEMLVNEINTKWNPPEGGLLIKGERYYVQLKHYDDEANPSKSVTGFRKLVEAEKVPFVIGPLGTPGSFAVMPVSEKSRTILVAYSASDKAHRMGNPFVLMTRPPAAYIGGPLAKAAFDRGWRKFAILSDVAEAWTAMSEEFKSGMQKLGGEFLGMEVVDTKTVTDFHPIMTQFKFKNPDVIFICAYSEPLAYMITHARDVGYNGHFVANNNFNQVTIKKAGLEKCIGTLAETMLWDYYLAHPDEDSRGVVTYAANLFRAKRPGVPLHDLISHTWDSGLTCLKAMEVAGSVTDTLAIRRAMDQAVKLISDKMIDPREAVLPSGQLAGIKELVAELQTDGTFKKVGELVFPTERLRVYKDPAESPLFKLK